ncbi:MAG: N-formylglutamate deformylase [Burkholderiaceae bacterium]|nr:N-formylglutamate deformylase [Burkholderiaceae bacterium]
MSDVFTLHPGRAPLLISMPHVGTLIPDELKGSYQPRALATEDTDWHLERLYGFAAELGASVIVPNYSRYVIDLNRPPEDTPMYPGASNTELCPTRFFTGDPLYLEGRAPDADEKLRRRERYWQPYHQALQGELQRLRAQHGHVVLFDAHSIKSVLPWLFEGKLPDLNLGTADGRSCDAGLTAQLAAVLAGQGDYTHIVNGRFKGGYITRNYGQPEQGIHTVQLEMCWSTYMQEQAPYAYDEAIASRVQPLLKQLLQTMLSWKPAA